jgi:hypothetical protein
MVLTVSFVLLGDRALLPPSSTDRFCLSPVGPTQLRELDASVGASGPHDFAVRCNISRPLACDRSQASSTRPAIPPRAKRCRVHRIPPRVRDDREPPLMWDETTGDIEVIWGSGEQNYFCERDSTDPCSASPSGKSLPMKPAAPVGVQALIRRAYRRANQLTRARTHRHAAKCWHLGDMPTVSENVRSSGRSGSHRCTIRTTRLTHQRHG